MCVLVAQGAVTSQCFGAEVSGTPLQKVDAASVLESVTSAWLRLQKPDGRFVTKTPGIRRWTGNVSELGYVLLASGFRLERGAQRTARLAAAVKALNYTVAHATAESPFPFLGMALAYRFASSHLADDPMVRRSMPTWGAWLLKRKLSETRPGRDCYNDPECWNNWHLVRGLAVAALMDSPPPGARPQGSWLEDPDATQRWLENLVRVDAPSQLGSNPVSTWSLDESGVLSDPPANSIAYHAFSVALLVIMHSVAPGLFDPTADRLLSRSTAYLLGLIAPDGDVAISGRSQLQSWTLGASALIAATRARGSDSGEWRAALERVVGRLASSAYRDPSGIFAITPSARAQTLDGVDLYAAPQDYNGITLMMLQQAVQAWPDAESSATSIPADRDGRFVDIDGGHLINTRYRDIWWQWQTNRTKVDSRYDSGLIQVKVRSGGDWTDLLAGRPITVGSVTIGPALRVGRELAPFEVESVSGSVDQTVLVGRFRPSSSGPVAADIKVSATTGGVEITWTGIAGQTFRGCVPLEGGTSDRDTVRAPTTVVTISGGGAFSRGVAAPGATSAFSKIHCWTVAPKETGPLTLSVRAA